MKAVCDVKNAKFAKIIVHTIIKSRPNTSDTQHGVLQVVYCRIVWDVPMSSSDDHYQQPNVLCCFHGHLHKIESRTTK